MWCSQVLLFLALLAAGVPYQGAPRAREPEPKVEVRGITISTHGGGRDWGSDRIVGAFKAVKAVGANWVTVHPYAWIRRDGRVGFRDGRNGSPPAYWVRPIEEAHALGLKILIKPHLAYWGSGWSWRGEISFHSPEQWSRFFKYYRVWILRLAGACKDADAFAVGTELDQTTSHTQAWESIIKGVRRETKASLTYAAHWSSFQQVPFWKLLDAVGIQAYFPVALRRSASEREIQAGWKKRMAVLRAFSLKVGKKVVFTELGYNRSFDAPVKPWDDRTDGQAAEVVQERCLKVALNAIAHEPAVVGCFLWKWFPPPHPVGRNFQLATPGMKAVIKKAWKRS